MPTISFAKGRPSLTVEKDANLMKSLTDAGIPVASSCGGEGVCTKCVIKIIEGRENLSAQNQNEQDLREMHDLSSNERVSCQTQVLGDIKIDTGYW